jgi:hypothetical protein
MGSSLFGIVHPMLGTVHQTAFLGDSALTGTEAAAKKTRIFPHASADGKAKRNRCGRRKALICPAAS